MSDSVTRIVQKPVPNPYSSVFGVWGAGLISLLAFIPVELLVHCCHISCTVLSRERK